MCENIFIMICKLLLTSLKNGSFKPSTIDSYVSSHLSSSWPTITASKTAWRNSAAMRQIWRGEASVSQRLDPDTVQHFAGIAKNLQSKLYTGSYAARYMWFLRVYSYTKKNNISMSQMKECFKNTNYTSFLHFETELQFISF